MIQLNKDRLTQVESMFNEYWELEYWSKKLGVSKEKIIEAVNAVGTSAIDVREYLHKQ